MNLLCPSCQKMLQVPEQYAGQQMRCPLCNSTFTVPPLPDAPSLAPPPAPAPGAAEVYPLADDHNPLAPPVPSTAPPPLSAPARAPAPPPVVGDYTKLRSIVISPHVVSWIAPIALLVLFLLMFFPWGGSGEYGFSPWSLGFGKGADRAPGGPIFIFYNLFVILGMLLSIVSVLMHLKVIPDSPALQGLQPWRAVLVLGFVGTAYLMLFLSTFINLFKLDAIWLNFWGWLADCTHCVAVTGLVLEMWLQLRGPTRPLPRIDIHS